MNQSTPATARPVLFITDDIGGGTGSHLSALVSLWDASRWRARIISQSRRYDPNLRFPCPVDYSVPGRWLDRYPLAQLRRLLQIRRSILNDPPELVHAYFFWSIIYGRVLKRLGLVKCLVENREDMGFSWGSHEYRLLRLTSALPDRIICVAEAVRQVVLDKERADPSQTVVLRNGIEPLANASGSGAALRRELNVGDDDLLVGMVANLNRPVKGGSYFLDAIPAILQRVPSARFMLVGLCQNEEALRARARALGVEAHLLFTGYRRDTAACYDSMDVSVLTSLSEGLSITILESMNHAVPVVVTRVGGNAEVVRDGETGFLVPPGDVPAFVDRVVHLLEHPELRARMGERARQRVKAEFHIRDVADGYLAVYDEVLSKTAR